MSKVKKLIKKAYKALINPYPASKQKLWIDITYLIFKLKKCYIKSLTVQGCFCIEIEKLREFLIEKDSFNTIKKIWLSKFRKSSDGKKFYISKMMIAAALIDEEIIGELISFAESTHDKGYRYWTANDLVFAVFINQKGKTPKIMAERKQLYEMIAYDGSYAIPAKGKNSEQRTLAIIAYHLQPTLSNSLFRCVKMIADGLSRYFDKIYVLTMDTRYIDDQHFLYYSGYNHFTDLSSVDYAEESKKLIGDNAEILFVQKNSYQARNQEFLNNLYLVNPSTILDLSDEFSFMSYYYAQDFPTFYLPLRSEGFCSFYDYRFTAKINKQDYDYDEENKVLEWMFPEYVPKFNNCYQRKDKNIDESSFVIVTAAYASNVCNEDFCKGMADLLKTHKNFRWLLIADTAPLYIKQRHSELLSNGQIIERPYENELYGLFRVCDVYLRTDTTAGSGSTAIAAMAGLPIVMTDYDCDALRWLGEDYTSIRDYKHLFMEIERLAEDKNYYEQRSSICMSLVEKVKSGDIIWQKLAELLNITSEELQLQKNNNDSGRSLFAGSAV